MEVLGASGAPWGTTSVEVADASPRLGDSVLGLLQDLVVRDAGASIAGSAALGDAAPALESLSIVSLGGIWTMRTGISWLFFSAHQLEAGGGRGGVYVIIGCHCGEVAA
jgi:hypothetical protein